MLAPSVAGSFSPFVVVRPWLATIVRIKCRGSKSDKFNTGNVKWLTVAAEDCLCPVELFCEYWDATEALGFEDDLPLFRHYDGKLVTSRQVVAAIKRQAEVMAGPTAFRWSLTQNWRRHSNDSSRLVYV